ncbi:MAG TPA: NAD-dependent epimerase/dehydratase family protein [Actinomycetales bacterium]|nr:NAD-dependent epimerase/dehydratase family protein [Actinomycetales bacterium]
MSRAVAVTGAAGFIGGHVVETLLAAGRHVVAIDRRPLPPALAALSGSGERVRYLQTEITDSDDDLSGVLAEADAVIHLAGCPGVRDHAPDVAWRRHRDNVLATGAVLAATPLATPLVVASSSSVYGGCRSGRPCREDDRLAPRGGYAESKVIAEQLCELRRQSGGSVTVARPFTVAGERQRPDMAIAIWLRAALAGEPLRLLGSPARTRDVTDARDAARAVVRLAEVDASTTVNVGTGRGRTLRELVETVRAVTSRELDVDVAPSPDEEVRHTLACTRRLESLVGFVPRTDLVSVVERQLQAMLADDAEPASELVRLP